MPALVGMQYLKTITRYICILVLYFSSENKQMFLWELTLKFNKYFKMLLHLRQSCPALLLHSFIPIKPFLYTSRFVCWSVRCAAVQLHSAEKQLKKEKRLFSRQITSPICFTVQLHKHCSPHKKKKKKQPCLCWQHQSWLICNPTAYFSYSTNTTRHLKMYSNNIKKKSTTFVLKAIWEKLL